MKSFISQIVSLVFVCIVGILIGFSFNKTKVEVVEKPIKVYMPVDSTQIVLKARSGYIKYDKESLLKEFGKTFIDTSIIFKDSLCIKDSINYINVPFLEGDTTYSVFLSDTVENASFSADIFIGATAYYYPVNLMLFNIVMSNSYIKSTCKEYSYEWKWYDGFNISLVPFNKPYLSLGYGISVGDLRRIGVFK